MAKTKIRKYKIKSDIHPSVCKCGGYTKTTDSRPNGKAVRRRRECIKCGNSWSTMEMRIDERSKDLMAIETLEEVRNAWKVLVSALGKS